MASSSSALGFALAKLRAETVAAPVLERRIGPVEVRGYVELVEPRATRGERLTLRVTALDRLPPAEQPYRVRVRTLQVLPGLKPGDAVRLRAHLAQPAPPALPGAYDFARAAWFQGIGALGFALARPEIDAEAVPPPLGLRIGAVIEGLRQAIGARVRAGLPGETGAIATALITGSAAASPRRRTPPSAIPGCCTCCRSRDCTWRSSPARCSPACASGWRSSRPWRCATRSRSGRRWRRRSPRSAIS